MVNKTGRSHRLRRDFGIVVGTLGSFVLGNAQVQRALGPSVDCFRLTIVAAFAWACGHAALAKGRSPHWGWMGLLHWVGVIVVLCIPRKRSKVEATVSNVFVGAEQTTLPAVETHVRSSPLPIGADPAEHPDRDTEKRSGVPSSPNQSTEDVASTVRVLSCQRQEQTLCPVADPEYIGQASPDVLANGAPAGQSGGKQPTEIRLQEGDGHLGTTNDVEENATGSAPVTLVQPPSETLLTEPLDAIVLDTPVLEAAVLPVRPVACRGIWEALGTCFLLFMIGAFAYAEILARFLRPGESLPAAFLFAASDVTMLLIAVLLLGSNHGRDARRVAAWRVPAMFHWALTVLLVAPLLVFVGYVTDCFWGTTAIAPASGIDWSMLKKPYEELAREPWLVMILVGCISPAIAEELFFRTLLGRGLVSAYGTVIGVFLTSLLFGLAHLEPQRICTTFLLGCVLHVAYVATKSLLVPMTLHALNNLLAFAELRYTLSGSLNPTQGDGLEYIPSGLFLASACAVFMLLLLLWRTRTKWVIEKREAWDAGFVSAEAPPEQVPAVAQRSAAGLRWISLAAVAYLFFAIAAGLTAVRWTALTYANRAVNLSDLGKRVQAAAYSERAVELAPRLAWVHVCRGWVLLASGDIDRALEHCDRAIEIDPDLKSAYTARAAVRYDKGEYNSAVFDCTRALRINAGDALAYSTRAAARVALGEFASAIDDATAALELAPDNLSALVNRGCARAELDRLESAAADLTRAIERDPENRVALRCRATVRYKMKDYAGAVDDATRAIRIDSGDWYAFYYRGLSYQEQERYDEAIKDFTESLEIDRNQESIRLRRGKLHLQLKDTESAIADFDDLISRFPDDDEPYSLRAAAHRLAGDEEKAVQDARRAAELNLAARVAQGWLLVQQRQYQRAIDEVDAALERFPQSADLYRIRAISHWNLQNGDQALEDYSLAARHDPGNPDIFRDRGELHLERGDLANSIADFTKAIQLDGLNTRAFYRRAEAYERSGQAERAKADRAVADELAGREIILNNR